jgi:hypothetical protein
MYAVALGLFFLLSFLLSRLFVEDDEHDEPIEPARTSAS